MADHGGGNRMRDEWRTQAFRSKIVSRLEDDMKKNPTPMPKSSIEMEEYVFQKAGNREEYLDLVARVLLSVSNERRQAQGQQDPIGALQNLAAGQAAAGMERPEPITKAEKLVAAVRKHVALYDKDDVRYANRHFIRYEWKKVGREIGMDPEEAKKKWTHLRDYFQKQVKLFKRATMKGQDPSSKRKWYLYSSMSFLTPYLSEKISERTMMDDDSAVEFEESVDSKEFDRLDNEVEGDVSSDGNYHLSGDDILGNAYDAETETGMYSQEKDAGDDREESDDSIPPMKRAKHDTHHLHPHHQHKPWSESPVSTHAVSMDCNNQDVVRTLSGIVESMMRRGERDHDDDHCFFKSLVPSMKTLDPITKMECQSEIQALVLKYVKKAALDSVLGAGTSSSSSVK